MAWYEWLIGTRYLRSTHRRGFVSFVALMSVCGLTLGVATLIVVLSVMNGFERELRSRILAVTSHATLTGLSGTLPDWGVLAERARRQSGVVAAVPYVESQAMLASGAALAGATVRGVLPEEERAATGLAQHVSAGSLADLEPGGFRIILGTALARELGVRPGGSVVVIAPQGTATPTGVVARMRRFRVVGLLSSGMYEFDRGLALTHMSDAARLFRLGDEVSGLRLALADPLRAPAVARRVALSLGGAGFYVSDWTQNHANFFRSIEITKSMMFVILLMLVAVAAFNIVATLVMIVKEKQTDIAPLRRNSREINDNGIGADCPEIAEKLSSSLHCVLHCVASRFKKICRLLSLGSIPLNQPHSSHQRIDTPQELRSQNQSRQFTVTSAFSATLFARSRHPRDAFSSALNPHPLT